MTSVLLYSGGMDSYICAALHQPDVLLHIDTGTAYGDVEAQRLEVPHGMEDRLTRICLRDLAQWERSDDLILPGRNAHLVLAAAHYGDTIMLGATAGDRTNDKNEEFVTHINRLLAHLYAPQWWIPEGRTPHVTLPIKSHSKRQLVRMYVDQGHDTHALVHETFSCYHPDHDTPCGNCKPCVRKWVALWAEGINPHQDSLEYAKTVLQDMMTSQYSRGEQELADFETAIRNAEAHT